MKNPYSILTRLNNLLKPIPEGSSREISVFTKDEKKVFIKPCSHWKDTSCKIRNQVSSEGFIENSIKHSRNYANNFIQLIDFITQKGKFL